MNKNFCYKSATHSQKKPALFTARCVLEPLINEQILMMINVK